MGLAKELRSRRKLSAREVLVPEWGDDSGAFKLYCRSITCYDLDQLQKKHPNFLNNMTNKFKLNTFYIIIYIT